MLWAVILLLALCTIYSLLYLAQYLDVTFFVLSNRGMVEQKIISSIVSNNFDHFLWGGSLMAVLAWLIYGLITTKIWLAFRLIGALSLLSLVVIICLILYSLVNMTSLIFASALVALLNFLWSIKLFGIDRLRLLKGLIFGVISVVLIIEFLSFTFYHVPTALNFGPQPLSAAAQLNIVELSCSNLTYPILPYAFLFFILVSIVSFFGVVAPKQIVSKMGTIVLERRRLNQVLEIIDDYRKISPEFSITRLNIILAVVTSIIISCLFVVFTIIPSSNPTDMLVSVDAPRYYEMITRMRSDDLNSAFSYALSNDRSLFLLVAYGLSFVLGTISVVQFASALLISMFCIVCFFFFKSLVRSSTVCFLGVLLVPFSFQALGLIYAGFYANMLALILVFLYWLVFLKARDARSSIAILSLFGLSGLILFSHSWTWFIFALSLIAFLFLEWRSSERLKNFGFNAALVGGSITVGLISDFSRGLLSPISSSASVTATVMSTLGIPDPSYILRGMGDSVYFTLGGIYANSLFLFLMLIGFFVFLRIKSTIANFLLAWVFISSSPILFASASLVFDRTLFLLPSGIFAGLGLTFIVRFLAGTQFEVNKSAKIIRTLVVLGFVFLMLVNFALRYIFNINVW
jgi:hypothetical protein